MKRLFRFGTTKKADSQEDAENRKEKVGNRFSGRRQTASRKPDYAETVHVPGGKEREKIKIKSGQNGSTGPVPVVEAVERRRERPSRTQAEPNPRLSNPPQHVVGEQVAAGWPAWLSAEAGEALKGWIPRRADSFEKLDKIGQGTYSNVYKARDLDSGKIVALKKVRFDNAEPESVRFMAREIQILRRLDHPNVVKLEGLVTSRMSCSLYLVFEYMEHDLAGLAACPGIKFTESQVKCYMQQILRGLDHCHTRGVLHRDIKGSNLLIDNGGILKIADFGLATFFHPDQKHPLTSRVVTLWYRPPELLLGATEYGAAVDLWSTGCILAELLAGKPIMPGRTEVEQLHKIFKLCGSPSEEYWKKSKLPHATIFKPQQPYKRCILDTFKDFPPSALALLEILLAIEPLDRRSAATALKNEFFTTKPLACDPICLPKYPPSKELDAKLRDEEARRQRAAGGRARGLDATKKTGSRENSSRAVPAPDANAELAASLQKHRMSSHGAQMSRSEKFNPQQDDTATGFPIDPPRQTEGDGGGRVHVSHPAVGRSGPQPNAELTGARGRKQKEEEETVIVPPRPMSRTKSLTVSEFKPQSNYDSVATGNLSSLSTLVAARNNGGGELRKDMNAVRQQEKTNSGDRLQNSKHEDVLESKGERKEIYRSENFSKGYDGFLPQDPVLHARPAPMGFSGRHDRIHFSGPILPPSANLDELLGEHEYKIQQAVRRARLDKGKSQQNGAPFKPWVNADASEFGYSRGPTLSSNGIMKTAKAHYTGEIIELQESELGLSSVMENYGEQET
eukprot:c27097_g1_i1 orf=683-3064(+)